MDTQAFSQTYPLEEVDVVSIADSKEGLSIVLDLNAYLWLIGNGFRSEISETYTHEFVFKGVRLPINLKSPIVVKNVEFSNDLLSFEANENKIRIPNVEVIIHDNVDKN